MSELKSHFNEIALVDTITKELIEWADIFISAGGKNNVRMTVF